MPMDSVKTPRPKLSRELRPQAPARPEGLQNLKQTGAARVVGWGMFYSSGSSRVGKDSGAAAH